MRKLPFILLLSILVGILFNSCQKYGYDLLAPEAISTDNLKGMSIEDLSANYFALNPKELRHKENLIHYVHVFYATLGNNEKFSSKKPCYIQPIYAYGIDGIAYYEIWFTENDKTTKGWLLISTTDKDYPIVNFSMGTPYSSRIMDTDPSTKVYRFGVSYFAAEKEGQKVGEYGQMPSFVSANTLLSGNGEANTSTGLERHSKTEEPVEGVDFYTIADYESLKQFFPTSYFTEQRVKDATEMKEMLTQQSSNRDPYSYKWVGGSKAFYTQIPKKTSANNTDCWSGCNNNAWANLYAWWDRNKSKSRLIPTTSTGENSPLYRNSTARRAAIDPVQMSIYNSCSTYCYGGTGWTKWSRMHRGYYYASSKNYGYNYQYRWCSNDGCHVELADIATMGIGDRNEEVVIGANSHIYVGYGWAQQPGYTRATWVYCYPGWKENTSDNVWIWWKNFNATTRITVY